jgi:hypothetical protein
VGTTKTSLNIRNSRAQSILRELAAPPREVNNHEWPRRRRHPERTVMTATDDADPIWPDLSYQGWSDTLATLQLWTQIVG